MKATKLKLKICGMRDADNMAQLSPLGLDYMGFIFYSKSPRFVGSDFTIPTSFPSSISRVGVFVNESVNEIITNAKKSSLSHIQLHGSEGTEVCAALKDVGLNVIKVFSVDEQTDFSITKPYEAVSDFFLFDTKGKYYGGNAQVFNWKLLERYDQSVPFFLSGGLSPENISSVSELSDMNIYALDVNSGVEYSPGLKDISFVKQLLAEVDKINVLKI